MLTCYPQWEEHFTILANGSLVIDQFGWRDRGEYACYVDNGAGAELARVELSLDHRYRSIVYYWSLVYGFVTAFGFLGNEMIPSLRADCDSIALQR